MDERTPLQHGDIVVLRVAATFPTQKETPAGTLLIVSKDYGASVGVREEPISPSRILHKSQIDLWTPKKE